MQVFSKLSGSRLFHELEKIFEDQHPVHCFLRLKELHLLETIHPKLFQYFNPNSLELVSKTLDYYSQLNLSEFPRPTSLYFTAICDWFKEENELNEMMTRLNLNDVKKGYFELMEKAKNSLEQIKLLDAKKVTRSGIYNILKPLSLSAILYSLYLNYYLNLPYESYFVLFLTQLQSQKLVINGNDLKTLGFKPGPHFAKVLKTILDKRLDQDVDDNRKNQLKIATELLKQEGTFSNNDNIQTEKQNSQSKKKK